MTVITHHHNQPRLAVPDHWTTAQVNRAVREITERTLDTFRPQMIPVYRDVAHDVDLRRAYGRRDYVHGFGNGLRATWVATYETTDRVLRYSPLVNYPGWDNADAYTRARVVINDGLRALPFAEIRH